MLDEAEEALASGDWETVRLRCDAVLRLDSANGDARTYLDAANQEPQDSNSPPAGRGTDPALSAPATPSHPSSFVAGRYRVERFLGEGGRKRVFLAHATTLDRDIAFAQIRTEGLDDLARERVMREAQSMARPPVPRRPSIAQKASCG